MPIPQLIEQDAVLEQVHSKKLTGQALRKKRAALKAAVKKVGGKVHHLLGPRDVRYKVSDVEKAIELLAA